VQLRSKRELIEKFIEENLPKLQPSDNVIGEFGDYWSKHKQTAFEQLCADEKIQPEQLQKLLQTYEFASRLPRPQEIKDALNYQPKVLERKTILGRVAEKIENFINTFIEGMGGSV
jgi:type I restriction enzyme, R subunit